MNTEGSSRSTTGRMESGSNTLCRETPKRVGRENEPDRHGESLEHACTCKAIQDVLGLSANDNGLCDKHITLNTLGRRYSTKSVDPQRHLVSTFEGVLMSCLCACCKGSTEKIVPEHSAMHIPWIRR